MKRTRKVIEIDAIPRGSNYQVCYFKVASNAMSHPNWNSAFVGPYLVDVANGRMVPFEKHIFDVSTFEEGDPDDFSYHWKPVRKRRRNDGSDQYGMVVEKGINHTLSYGCLHPFDGTYSVSESGKTSIMFPFTGSSSYRRTRLLSLNPDGTRLSYLRTYARGSSTPTTYATPVYLDMEITSVSNDGKSMVHSVWAGNCYTSIFDGVSAISCRPKWPDVLNFNANGSITVKFECETWSKAGGFTVSTQTQDVVPIFTSPVLYVTNDIYARRFQYYAAFVAKLREHQGKVAAIHPIDCHYKACESAVDAIRISDINGISFIKELFEIKSLIEPIIKVLAQPFSVKNWANLVLSWLYGWKLSWADCKVLFEGFTSIKKCSKTIKDYAMFRNSLKTVYGTYTEDFAIDGIDSVEPGISRTNCRVVARWEIPTKATWLGGLTALVEDMGLRLNMSNVWDLIPYSFVFDWFYGFDQFAKQWDFRCEIDRLRLRERVKSLSNKIVTTDTCYYEEFGLVGSVTHKSYLRQISSEFPSSPMKLGGMTSLGKHSFEGTLLILARIAK